jgi:hypothetical protein
VYKIKLLAITEGEVVMKDKYNNFSVVVSRGGTPIRQQI